MPVWVDCRTASSYFRGFAADMGPYIGPWPLLPPGEMSGLSGSAYIDFFVALPNPAAPTDVTVVADGTYDTPIWDAYRYSSGFDYFGDATGATPSVPATAPAGVHLYVIVYDGSTAPTNPPEFYVPASYAAGGSAAFETEMGHWSGYQAGYDESGFASSFGGGDGYFGDSDHTYSGNVNLATLGAAAAAEDAASTPVTGGIDPIVYAIKDQGNNTTRLRVTGNVQWKPYTGAPFVNADSPPGLGPLDWDVDYSDTPYIDADGNSGKEYEYSAPPTFDWDAFGPDDGADNKWRADAGAGPGVMTPPDLKIRIQWLPGTTVAGRPMTVSGNLIEDRIPQTAPGLAASRVDYSGVTDIEFAVFWSPQFLYGGLDLPDFPFPGSLFEDMSIYLALVPSTPKLNVHRSTWRYWVPGGIVPSTHLAWHNFTGHYANFTGATHYIFTPGLGPVPMADGLP